MSDSSTPPIRTLLVDDHPVVRFGVKHMLDAEEDIEVVGRMR
jgi:DNA-binding NarL/FixJ family response regulator